MKWTIIQITDEKTQCCQLVMGCDQNLRELSTTVISCFALFVNHKLYEWQFSLLFVILSDELANFWVISHEIADISKNQVWTEFHNLEL